jgi:hypothetical protein
VVDYNNHTAEATMLERLEGYDWAAHVEQEPRATRMPRLLRRYLTGGADVSRRSLRAIWFALSGDDGYIGCEGLFALTAVAVVEALPELDAEGRRRAARLLHGVGRDMWLNIYGEPGEAVSKALRDRLAEIRTLLNEEVPDTVGLAARLLRHLGEREPEVARRVLAVFPREHHAGRRVRLIAALAHHGRRAFFPFLIDEVANDPEPVVRWRAALAVARALKKRTPDQEARVLVNALLDRDGQRRMRARVPAVGHLDMRTMEVVLLLSNRHAVPALIGLLRGGEMGARQAIEPLLSRLAPWPVGAAPHSALQKEVLAALADCPALDPPSHPALRNPLHAVLQRAGLPPSRAALRELALL